MLVRFAWIATPLLVALGCSGAAETAPSPVVETPADRGGLPREPVRSKAPGSKTPGSKTPASEAPVGSEEPVVDRQCDVSGYLVQRSGNAPLLGKPNPKAPEVGRLDLSHVNTTVSVTARKGGYLEVDGANVKIPEGNGARGPVKGAAGWLAAENVRVSAQGCLYGDHEMPKTYAARLFGEPSLASAVVVEYDDSVSQLEPLGCSGSWWKVRDRDGREGWLYEKHACDNNVTDCMEECPEIAPSR